MRILRVVIERYRGLERFELRPGSRTVLIGPNNAGKSTVLEALDLLLHPGLGRPRPASSELEYFSRSTDAGFSVEAVLADLTTEFRAEAKDHLEGWSEVADDVVPETDGPRVSPVVRVRVRGTDDLDVVHEFAKPESAGARFGPTMRSKVGWVFDGRARDPSRQLAFYRGGVLDRLFAPANLTPAVDALRVALGDGAGAVNSDTAVIEVLGHLAADLQSLGLLESEKRPAFEVGALSERELLQALRLSLPAPGGVAIPLSRQGRGAQRLVLVTALLRLARASNDLVSIGGFEEPEEALEPVRQRQLAAMLRDVADSGGQIFLVTHSPEIVRSFSPEDLVVLDEPARKAKPRPLASLLSADLLQRYESRLDRSVVQALFAPVPVLVEGPSDRAALEVFAERLATEERIPRAASLGIDFVSCEGWREQLPMAALLAAAGKSPVVLVERDVDALEELRKASKASALILYPEDLPHLEAALAHTCELDALSAGMCAVASDRGVDFDDQRAALIAAAGLSPPEAAVLAAASVLAVLSALGEGPARRAVCAALGSDSGPFGIKSSRAARLFAQAVVRKQGVPKPFDSALIGLKRWIEEGRRSETEIPMAGAEVAPG